MTATLSVPSRPMSDIADRAQTLEALNLAGALASAGRAGRGPALGNACLFCAEPLVGRRWCSAECRDGWQREKDALLDPRNIKVIDDNDTPSSRP